MLVYIFSRSYLLTQFARALLTLGKAHFLNEHFLYMRKTWLLRLFSDALSSTLEGHIFYVYSDGFFIVNPPALGAESLCVPGSLWCSRYFLFCTAPLSSRTP